MSPPMAAIPIILTRIPHYHLQPDCPIVRRLHPLSCRPVPDRRRHAGDLIDQGSAIGAEVQDLEDMAVDRPGRCCPSCWSAVTSGFYSGGAAPGVALARRRPMRRSVLLQAVIVSQSVL